MTQNDISGAFAARYTTPQGQQGLAAAELCMDVVDLLNDVEQLAGIQRKDIAALLDVTAGRVSQVLNGDGNITIAALAKFLHAMGHEAVITHRTLVLAEARSSADCSLPDPEVELIQSVEREMQRFGGRMTTSTASFEVANERIPATRTQKISI